MLQSKSPSICQHKVKQVFTSCQTLLFDLLEQSLQYIWFTNVPIDRFSTATFVNNLLTDSTFLASNQLTYCHNLFLNFKRKDLHINEYKRKDA